MVVMVVELKSAQKSGRGGTILNFPEGGRDASKGGGIGGAGTRTFPGHEVHKTNVAIASSEIIDLFEKETGKMPADLVKGLEMPVNLYSVGRFSFSSDPAKNVHDLAFAARTGILEQKENELPDYGITLIDSCCTLVDKKRGIRIIGENISGGDWSYFKDKLNGEVFLP